MSAAGKLFLVTIEVLSSTEGMDLPRFLQKMDGLLRDYSTATHVIYKFKGEERRWRRLSSLCITRPVSDEFHYMNWRLGEQCLNSFAEGQIAYNKCLIWPHNQPFCNTCTVSHSRKSESEHSDWGRDGIFGGFAVMEGLGGKWPSSTAKQFDPKLCFVCTHSWPFCKSCWEKKRNSRKPCMPISVMAFWSAVCVQSKRTKTRFTAGAGDNL